MANLYLRFRLIFASIFLVATTYTCLGAQNITVACSEQERQALLKFKHSVTDQFKILSSWVGSDCCRWKGVLCDGASGSVASLHLRGNVRELPYIVTGGVYEYLASGEDYYYQADEDYFYSPDYQYLVANEVNSALGELRHLKYLDLSGNDFRGSQIPKFIGSFKQLSYLNLSNAGFGGIIPHHIGNLSNLQVLDLSSSYLSPPLMLEDMAWVSGLLSLNHLDLSNVDLMRAKNVDMVIYMIPSLIKLSLSRCKLFDVALGPPHLNSSRTLPNLKHLDLSSNFFEGQLPVFIQNMTSLEFLDLSSFNLTLAWNSASLLSMIPSLSELRLSYCGINNMHLSPANFNFSYHSNIRYLDLFRNSIKGRFPSVLTNMTSLRVLDLFGNSLNSSIPVMPNLLKLDLSENNFKHIEDVGILRQCHLKQLYVMYNHFEEMIVDPLSNVSECSQHALERLYMDSSQIDKIPESFKRLTNLRVLHLIDSALTGPILKALGPIPTFLEKLTELHLSGNQLTGPIPESLGRLTNLRVLRIASNELTGVVPEVLGKLKFLEVLDLSSNQLNGHIPTFHGALTKLHLSNNHLNGSIPESLGTLTNLRVLSLTSNRLTGPIPKALERLRLLEVLDLSYNHLSGPIPTLCGKLIELHLSNNQLNGSIPESLGGLTNLIGLHLESNRLTGPIPTVIGRLASLQAFLVYSNMLNGKIPVSFGQLTKLQILDASNNSLEGVVSEAHFANLSMLKYMDTTSNYKLTFNVTREWIPPFQLNTIRLSSCKIVDEFPQWVRTQRKLEVLLLSNTSIFGPLPIWLRNMSDIQDLDISHNELIGPLTNLPLEGRYPKSLLLQNNLFNGSIPRSLCRKTTLIHLDLSRNRLTGKIPNCLKNLQQLDTMMLSSNELSGVIPNISPSLTWLTLNDNNLIGELPGNLGNLRYLSVLDLGENELSGNIPEWIGENFRNLLVLRLHKNNFTGRIPRSLCKNSNLQILDVANNNLNGPIPHCFGELSGMINSMGINIENGSLGADGNVMQIIKGVELEYTTTLAFVISMDLSSNKLVGEIPEELTTLSLLMFLNLSHNYLSGSIPDNIGNMKALNSLDLSVNKFSGMIPPSMAALNFLSHLNLSQNNFSGRIPTGNQLQTLIDPSIYSGNKNLCGAPLPKNCSDHEGPTTITSKHINKVADDPKSVWFYLDIICGFATGFWGVIGLLLFKKQWRQKLFTFSEVTMDKIHVAMALRVIKMKRGREVA